MKNDSVKTQKFFSEVVSGKVQKPAIEYIPLKMDCFGKEYFGRSGNFDRHIFCSIPSFFEAQNAKILPIVKFLKEWYNSHNKRMIDLGGSEGTFVGYLARLSEADFFNLEPNKEMILAHLRKNKHQMNCQVLPFAFYEGFDEIEAYVPVKKFAVVHESMLFQFITNERQHFIKHIKDNYISEEGVFFTEQKFKTLDRSKYELNERIKDIYKSQYFSLDELKVKADSVLVGMKENQAYIESYEGCLLANFNHVFQYWSAGNFAGYLCTDSKDSLNFFAKELGKIETPYGIAKGQITL